MLEGASIFGTKLTVDLPDQRVIRPDGESYFEFDIYPFCRGCLLNGLNKIGLTLEKVDIISKLEKERSKRYLWLDGAVMRVPDAVPMYPDAEY